MSNIIDKIQVSGVTYDIQGSGGGGITSGEVQTMIDESISGKADTNNTVQSVGLSTLADGKSITAVIPSGNTYTGTIFKVGNGLTWQGYNSTIVVDTSKIAQKTDIPTVSSAITSGDTNPVQGGVLYDKFDEIEQVTAAALNELNDKIEEGGGGNPTVELTQAEYDALVSAGTVSADTYYIITDATAFDPSTKVDTSAFTAYSAATNTALNGKVDTSSVVSSVTSASTDSEIPTAKAVWEAASGGGKAIEAGRGISITTGATADTVSFDLPISAATNGSILIGVSCSANREKSFVGGQGSIAQGEGSFAFGQYCKASQWSIAVGNQVEANITSNTAAFGKCNKQNGGMYEPESATTLFSVGNGTAHNERHNAFEIRQNGDIYLTKDGQDVKLQDQLGGSSITVDTALDSGSTNPVENRVIYNKIDEVEQVTAAGLNALNDNFGGLKLVKLTQAAYDALTVKDPNTLYIILG